jgi:drug/metabolite transporter (DMT)-like permease
LVFTGFSGQKLTGFSTDTYIYLILLGLIPQLLGHSIFNWALGHLPAVFVSIALIGEPIGTIILAFLFLKESPKNLEYLGGFLILLGIFIVSFINSQRKRV